MNDEADEPAAIIDLKATKEEISQAKRKVILFCHLHKTGGTTIERMLLETYEGTAHRVSSPNELNAFRQKLNEGLLAENNTYLVYGHRARLLIDELKDQLPTFPFTIMRRPLSLFESNFSFQHTRQGNTTLTTEEYLQKYPKNRIIDFLGANNFRQALRNAHRDYLVVGITERLEETAAILSYLFDLPARPYRSRNVTNPANYVEADFDLVIKFLRENADDRKLYDYFDALQSRVYRQLVTLSETSIIELETTEGTYNCPIQINRDLEKNNDKFSLVVTGQEIWPEDPERAIAFFDKAFSLDWAISGRILNYLKTVDADSAQQWAKVKMQELGPEESEEIKANKNRLKKWAEK